MAHYISSVEVENFCSCKKHKFPLELFTPLVGYNNAGKTNIIKAISWLLKKSTLDESCFFDKNNPVRVSAKVQGISEEILDSLEIKHKNSIEPYISDSSLTYRRIQPSPSCKAADVKIEVWDGASWRPNPAGIENAIKMLFPEPISIEAMDDATKDVGKFAKSSTIGRIISEVMQPIEEVHGAEINDHLERLAEKLSVNGNERAEELTSFDEEANEKLSDLFPGLTIKLHVPRPSISSIFESGTIRVFEDGYASESGRDVSSFGHGTQRSIQMALVRHLAEVKKANTGSKTNTLLLIDEPELYLHPQAVEHVRVALKKLSSEGYQVVFTTHSAQMIDSEDAPSTLLIRKGGVEGTYAMQRLKDAVREAIGDNPNQVDILFSLTNANKILFSEMVLLAEGKTERRLLPNIFQQVTGKTLGEKRIGLVELGGVGNTGKSLKVLKSMGLPSKSIVDLDYAFRGAIEDGLLSLDGVEITKLIQIIANLKPTHNFETDELGLPRKGGDLMSSEVFELLAQDQDAEPLIESIHEKLKAENIWIWKKGAIEAHLGIDGKNEGAWSAFIHRLKDETYEEVVEDSDGVLELFTWLLEPVVSGDDVVN
jgi:energy-coupling factor transporter ATP-binding protein EcfA2